MKESLFLATVESVLLYGSETWTLTRTMEKQLNGCYTRLLRMAMGVSWKDHVTNERLYGSLLLVSLKIQKRRMRLAGHCHEEEIASTINSERPNYYRTIIKRSFSPEVNLQLILGFHMLTYKYGQKERGGGVHSKRNAENNFGYNLYNIF